MSCCPLIALKHAELTHLVPLKLPYFDDEMSLSLAYNNNASSRGSKSAKATCLLPKCLGVDACAGADEDNIGCGRFVTFLLGSSLKCSWISNFVAVQFLGLPVALGTHYTCRNIHSFITSCSHYLFFPRLYFLGMKHARMQMASLARAAASENRLARRACQRLTTMHVSEIKAVPLPTAQ